MMRERIGGLVRHVGKTLLLALVGVTAAIGILFALAGPRTLDAGEALWLGSFGSTYAFLSGTLVRATPLMLAGCAVTIAFRAGALNIGAEGQLLAGAAAATATALAARPLGALAMLLAPIAGAIAGAAWAGIAAALRVRYNVLEVISTILLNFIAMHLVGWLVRGPLQEPTNAFPQSASIPVASRLPIVFEAHRLHWGFLVALAAAMGAWFFLSRTAAGFRVRVTGMNPLAAESAGQIDVRRVLVQALMVSGAVAGLAGAVEVQGVTFALYENLSPGYGYTGIAVAMLARLDPLLVVPSAIFFGALESGAAAMQRDAAVPAAFASIIEAMLVLALVALAARRRPGGA